MPPKKRKALSHAEIWDDSALQDTWNEAYEEYLAYHSLEARGEDVEEVLREVEEREAAQGAQDTAQDPAQRQETFQTHADRLESGEVGEVRPTADQTAATAPQQEVNRAEAGYAENVSRPLKKAKAQTAASSVNGEGPANVPHSLVGGVQDEALKNLMMSWYYAGYYTGLHQGLQQAPQGEGQSSQAEG